MKIRNLRPQKVLQHWSQASVLRRRAEDGWPAHREVVEGEDEGHEAQL